MREEPGPLPSSHAAERLATDVGAEMADLRATLRWALDEADRLQAVGRNDLAAEVLEEQRVTLAAVHQQLTDRLAAAAVEREAEHIVERSRPQPTTPAPTAAAGDGTFLRLLASAAAAAAGMALLFAPDIGGGALQAAGWSPVVGEGAPPTEVTPTTAGDASTGTSASPEPATGPVPAPTSGVEAPRTPSRSPASPATTPETPHRPVLPVPLGLTGLEQLVGAVEDDHESVPAPTASDLPEVDVDDDDHGEWVERER